MRILLLLILGIFTMNSYVQAAFFDTNTTGVNYCQGGECSFSKGITSSWIQAANLIASKGLITDYSASPEKYRLSDTITRKESIKIIVKLAGGTPGETCEGKFKDISKSDWSCKYVEWALTKGLIASASTFRPDDNITRAEVLKLIFKAKGLTKSYSTTNWQSDYYKSALDMGLIDASQDDGMYSANALRGWIFYTVSKTYENPIEQQKVISNEAL